MTSGAALRQRSKVAFLIVTTETNAMGSLCLLGVLVFVRREKNLEFRNDTLPFCRTQERLPQGRKWKARRVARTNFDMAVRTDPRCGSFTREELRAMTLDARLMIRKLGDIRESITLFANEFPIRRGKFVTRITFQLVVLVAV